MHTSPSGTGSHPPHRLISVRGRGRRDVRGRVPAQLTAVLLATVASAAIVHSAPAWAADTTATADISPSGSDVGEVVVTARHRAENVQSIPATVSVVTGAFLDQTDTKNISQLITFLPSVQFSFSNPRNSSLNIRGLGNLSGIASDGTDPGVGFYVDQVYYARPATTTFDFVDIDHVEVLDGPQGTLFGKNTTAGVINVTTAGPTFHPEAKAEFSGGDYGYYVAKGSISGPIIGDVLAGRLAISASGRGGTEVNDFNGDHSVNNYHNFTVRSQLLYKPTDDLSFRLIGDYNKQTTNCCVNVLSSIVFPANGKNFITATEHFGYTPVVDPFSRHLDFNSPVFANQETGGVSLQGDWRQPSFVLSSITAWRFWNWWPGNDVDSTPLSVLTAGNQNDYERQVSQEFRIASAGANRVDYVAGLYFFHEDVSAKSIIRYGDAGSYFLLGPPVPSVVLDGWGYNSTSHYTTTSYAAYGQATWHITPKLDLTGGLRYTDDHKDGQYAQTVPDLPPLIGPLAGLNAIRLLIAFPTAYTASLKQGAISDRIDLSYKWNDDILTYVTYARGNRSGGINLTQPSAGSTPTIGPETIDNAEVGAKTRFFDRRLTLNASLFYEWDHDYQGTVNVPGTITSYLANIPKVISEGVELSAEANPTSDLSLYASGVYDDAYYANFPASPCGLENVLMKSCSLTGRPLAGVPRWSLSTGGELHHPVALGALPAVVYVGVDDSFRSAIYTAETDSIYTREPNLNLLNARIGVRAADGRWNLYVWGKNITNERYFTASGPGIGNTGAIFSSLGDPGTWGVTLSARY